MNLLLLFREQSFVQSNWMGTLIFIFYFLWYNLNLTFVYYCYCYYTRKKKITWNFYLIQKIEYQVFSYGRESILIRVGFLRPLKLVTSYVLNQNPIIQDIEFKNIFYPLLPKTHPHSIQSSYWTVNLLFCEDIGHADLSIFLSSL